MRILLLALGIGLLSACATTPPTAPNQIASLPALAGDYFQMRSAATGHDYHLHVRLPADYAKEPDRRYPVVYLLDGDSLFPILGANHLFLTYDDKLPEAIVVGIAYGGFDPSVNKRHIDFNAPDSSLTEAQAGAPRFQQFLADELFPEIERRYRGDSGKRIIFGQSRGGGFVLYSAYTRPDLFWGHIASNAAFEPGAKRYFVTPTARADTHLIVASGTRDRADLHAIAQRWATHWKSRKAPWQLHFVEIQDGTHAANATDAYRAGMRELFGWKSE